MPRLLAVFTASYPVQATGRHAIVIVGLPQGGEIHKELPGGEGAAGHGQMTPGSTAAVHRSSAALSADTADWASAVHDLRPGYDRD